MIIRFIFILLFICNSVFCKEDVIDVELSKDKVKVGEVFTYTIKIKGDFVLPKLTLPDFKDFKVVSQSQSQSYSFSFGKTNLEFYIVYKLLAVKPGKFTLKEVVLKDKNRTFKSESKTIEVIGEPIEEYKKEKKDKIEKEELEEEGFII